MVRAQPHHPIITARFSAIYIHHQHRDRSGTDITDSKEG
jgi:hypothetical protein